MNIHSQPAHQKHLESALKQLSHGHLGKARFSLKQAISTNTKSSDFWFTAGDISIKLENLSLAVECYQKGIHLSPGNTSAHIAVAAVLEKLNRIEEAKEHLKLSSTASQLPPQGILVLTTVLIRSGHPDQAITHLKELLNKGEASLIHKIEAEHRLYQAYDQLGEFDQAFQHLQRSKDLNLRLTSEARAWQMRDTKRTSYIRLADIIDRWDSSTLERWKTDTQTSNHVHFLLGHPRSGTTLLENIMDANDGLYTSDERTSFQDIIIDPIMSGYRPIGRSEDEATSGFHKYLDKLKRTKLHNHSQKYLRNLEEKSGTKLHNRILLDKNPAITDGALLALRVFPNAKFLLSLRDPRAVVWSSYTLPMVGTSWIGAFWFNLEDAAEGYDLFMNTMMKIKACFPADQTHITRYEDTVKDLVSEGKKATQFLGLSWQEQQEHFHERASNKHVRSPTYADVAKPVYTTALEKWKHYEKYMSPILDKLSKQVRNLGYDS